MSLLTSTMLLVIGFFPLRHESILLPLFPLQMVRAVGQDTFQPKIEVKTRYGIVENPFSQGATQGMGTLTHNSNRYYRRVKVANLM